MLQLQTSSKISIIKVSKLLAQFKIKASITDQTITLNDGDISDELIDKINNEVTIDSVQNFSGEAPDIIPEEVYSNETVANFSPKLIVKNSSHKTMIPANCQEYDLLFPTVKRGEMYLCDFGEPYGNEVGFIRPAIILKNNTFENVNSEMTIVLPCTSNINKHYKFCHISHSPVFDHTTCIDTSLIRSVSKLRLRKFIATLDEETMEKLQECIDNALDLKREVKKGE